MINSEFINAIKAQAFDAIVKQAKGTKDDATALLQLIQNSDMMVSFSEKSLGDLNATNAAAGN